MSNMRPVIFEVKGVAGIPAVRMASAGTIIGTISDSGYPSPDIAIQLGHGILCGQPGEGYLTPVEWPLRACMPSKRES